jgi:membrane-associated phospholipid phosphatase
MTGNDVAAGKGPSPITVAWTAAGAGLLMTAAGLLGADAALARTNLASSGVERVWGQGVALLDLAAGKEITNFLLGAVLIIAGLVFFGLKRRPPWPRALLFVGTVQLLCTAIADFAKPPFGRLRPFQAMAGGQGSDRWFMGPDFGSFPSGHVAFYAGLALPLALLFPRWRAPLLAVPLLVGGERVVSHDHYVSDVGAAFLLAGLVTALLWALMRRKLRRGPIAGTPADLGLEIAK